MFSELEQVECLIQTNRVSQQSQPPLYDLAGEIQCRIAQPEHDLTGLSLDGLPKDDLYYVLERYLRNTNSLAAAIS